MKVDWPALALRWAVAWFFLCVVALFLAAVGAGQSFLEGTQARLFQWARWLTWMGLGGTWMGLVPLCRGGGRRGSALLVALGFASLTVLVLVWGVWLHPVAEFLPW